ncbi:hypothetical protein [Mammaliicoccus sp. P-M59]|uniref:hypothetical protein n=1 Tax=Mammaliicoccus sp. P-M59 TaxID=2898718 RepID=UPI001EFBFA56|nr:hypothetical protein [Mammaliicoccus sp. P-M59]
MNEILNFEFLTNQDNKRLTEFINKSQKLCYEKGLLTEKEIQFSCGQDFKVYKQDNKYHFVKNDVDDIQSCEHLILDNFDDLTTEIYMTLDNALESIGYYIDYEDDWNNIA